MPYAKNPTGGGSTEKKPEYAQGKSGFMDGINGALGGGKKSERKEGGLDKGPVLNRNFLSAIVYRNGSN